MMSRRLLSLPALALAGFALATSAPAVAQDKGVQDRLDKEELIYEVDEDGDYKLVFDYDEEGRTQIVFVSGKTEEVGGLTIREIFAPAARVDQDGINGAKALELLTESGGIKVGSWEIRGEVLYFVIKVPETMTATELGALVRIAAETADDKEIELSGTRDDL
jgi:hypothetical protein